MVPTPAVGSRVSKAVEKLLGKIRGIVGRFCMGFLEEDWLRFGADLSFFVGIQQQLLELS